MRWTITKDKKQRVSQLYKLSAGALWLSWLVFRVLHVIPNLCGYLRDTFYHNRASGGEAWWFKSEMHNDVFMIGAAFGMATLFGLMVLWFSKITRLFLHTMTCQEKGCVFCYDKEK